MPSFDIVSRVNLPEVDNAIQGVRRELTQRYDFKDTKSSVERNEGTLTIVADDDMRLRQLHELLRTYLVRRQVDPESLEYQTPEDASGGTLRQLVLVREGIPADMAKRITKAIKDAKLIASDVDEVLVVGGSTRIPLVQKLVQDLFALSWICFIADAFI